ncbi:RNA repair domain-containing protein [Phytomonospora sp. NPDC050363]|uniref:RNA repair domain-containing protein n=1 Tax=Phytomonospora sp. NPDC050363 TaxID=3155642 RepID=UPI00340AF025
MRTSDEIYHRVRWDARFDPARFVVGVAQRGREPQRVPLTAFTPGGDVPWHRVVFVEADGSPVWDRASGLDVLDSAGLGLVRHESVLRPPFFAARAVRGQGTATAAAVRVLTWNTLWDRFESHRVRTAERRPLLLAALEAAGADVIALQEVEAPLLAMLEPWTAEGWALLGEPRDVDKAGLVLLSRLPVREGGWHALSPHKAVAAIVVETATGPLTVLNTHLTSDHTPGGAGRRGRELARIAEGLSGVDGDVVVVGDFNEDTARPGTLLAMRDAWTEARGDGTPTFDPVANPLAAIASLSGRPGRIDRIFLRGPRATAASLHGDTPVGGLHPSDHYGLSAVLGSGPVEDVLDVAPGARTALAWIPPEGLWEPIQRVRREHDPSFDRWPPHVNVLFGFVPEADFECAAPLAARALTGVAPFTARLGAVGRFEQGTVWQHPGDDGWIGLRGALEGRFPRCAGRSYTPHLTVGRGSLDARLPVATARVTELTLLSRRGDGPMEPRATVALGTGEVRWITPPPTAPEPARTKASSVVARVTAALPCADVHLVGSRALDCELPGADVDLVAAGTVPAAAIAALPGVTGFRELTGARVPGMRFRLGDLAVDLAVAPGEPRDVARRTERDPDTAVTLSAVGDAEALRGRVHPGLVRQVKAWARARGLDSAPFGTPPGLAWTVLAALVEGDLRDFFAHWAAWDWRRPVALTGSPEPTGEPMTVLTPSAPVRSCTAQVLPGMAALIAEELYRGWELAGSPELAAPPPMHRRHRAWAVVTVTARDGFEAARGRMRGRMNALLARLPADAHAWPRAFEERPGRARYAVGLGRDTPGDIAGILASWTRGQAGVSAEVRAGGEVPDLR